MEEALKRIEANIKREKDVNVVLFDLDGACVDQVQVA